MTGISLHQKRDRLADYCVNGCALDSDITNGSISKCISGDLGAVVSCCCWFFAATSCQVVNLISVHKAVSKMEMQRWAAAERKTGQLQDDKPPYLGYTLDHLPAVVMVRWLCSWLMQQDYLLSQAKVGWHHDKRLGMYGKLQCCTRWLVTSFSSSCLPCAAVELGSS